MVRFTKRESNVASGYVLGISCFFHDSAASIVQNGNIIAASEEERFTRKKHDNSFPIHAARFCLKTAGIDAAELDAVVFFENPAAKLARVTSQFVRNLPRSTPLFRRILRSWHVEKLWADRIIAQKLGVSRSKIFFTDHHASHASAGYYNAGFDSTAILTLDGVGEWATTTAGTWSNGGKLILDTEIQFPHSLGLLYSSFAEHLGFEVNEGEFKVMGMSSYGTPRYVDKIEKLFMHRSCAGFELNRKYFSYEYSTNTNITQHFIDLMGPGRKPEEPFFLARFADEFEDTSMGTCVPQEVIDRSIMFADIAASIQLVVEDQVVSMAKHLRQCSGQDNLIMGGGVAYNCVANGRVIREAGFKNTFIFPAAGDSGSAVGAAQLYSGGSSKRLAHAYLGEQYSDARIRDAITKLGMPYTEMPDDDALVRYVADAIVNGTVIGWFQNRFEFGPRALGNRSIIADPRKKATKRRVNESVKYREVFRPFAPIVVREEATKFFDMSDEEARQIPYEFMLSICNVREQYRADLGATTHANGSSRVQLLREESNPILYKLLKTFGERTGFPILLNTSFNRRGEPLVASPEDALRTFSWSGLGMLAMGSFIISKDLTE
jgi:carbamoyltransferase